MTRGKKTDNETIYKVMLSMFHTNNISETARNLNLPITTVEHLYKANKDKEEFVKLGNEKKEEFVEVADKIINKATMLLDKRLTTALEKQDELEMLLDTISDVDNEEMSSKEKLEIARKLSRIQLNALNEITTAIGTIYDKRALAKGNSTSNINMTYEDIIRKVSSEDEY